MTCLNCGAEGAEAYCPRCGQRHVPRESYDMYGLFVDYTIEVVGSLRILKTLWMLVRHPGLATREYMAGRRKPQVNPVWMYLFFWSTLITAGQLVMEPEPANLGNMSDPQIHALMVGIAPWFMAVMAYTQPLAGLLGTALGIRALATDRWLEAWVYALQIETIGIILVTPGAMLWAKFGMWGSNSWIGFVSMLLTSIPIWVYSLLAFRGAFGDRLDRPFLRWLGSIVLSMGVGFVWSAVLAVGLWVTIAVGAMFTLPPS